MHAATAGVQWLRRKGWQVEGLCKEPSPPCPAMFGQPPPSGRPLGGGWPNIQTWPGCSCTLALLHASDLVLHLFALGVRQGSTAPEPQHFCGAGAGAGAGCKSAGSGEAGAVPPKNLYHCYIAWFNPPYYHRWHIVATQTREVASRSVPYSKCAVMSPFVVLGSCSGICKPPVQRHLTLK